MLSYYTLHLVTKYNVQKLASSQLFSLKLQHRSAHPVHLHDLKPLRDVGRVGGQPRASRDETHEEDPLLVGELLQCLPEPLHQGVLLIHLPVAHHLLQHVAADLGHAAHHLLQLLGRQQRQQRHRYDPRHALTNRRHLRGRQGQFELAIVQWIHTARNGSKYHPMESHSE